ncbi:hypothetical protein [Asticcacaulis sp.]|uniref:hypothetical protein n=1 Tax=Asticcacaulis sp. TaxID=1872648 RepID=UPI00391A7454
MVKLDLLVNRYERKARLFPALLVTLPIIVASLSFISLEDWTAAPIVTFVASIGVLFLLANIGRDAGKSAEEGLFRKWGGKPSTFVQRHRDMTLDRHTKHRCHSVLSQGIKVAYPTAADEASDPAAADEVYRSGVSWLIGQTRDTEKYALLFDANIAYGYKRNAFGLKWLGIGIAVLTSAAVLGFNGIRPDMSSLSQMALLAPSSYLSLSVSVAMVLIWLFYFTETTVKRAAFTYAERLLETTSHIS